MTLESLKEQLIKGCNAYFQELIYKVYKPHTQMNIALGIEGDLNTIKAFIQAKKQDYQALKTAIESLNSTSIRDSFLTGSDAAMKNHVTNFMPDLTTDEQKIAVALALQAAQ